MANLALPLKNMGYFLVLIILLVYIPCGCVAVIIDYIYNTPFKLTKIILTITQIYF